MRIFLDKTQLQSVGLTESKLKVIFLYIVNSHHKVLKAWAHHRREVESAPRLITLDHHTDTSLPFRNYIKNNPNLANSDLHLHSQQLIEQIDFNNEITIENAIDKLNNDEHIITAIKSDIISSAFVIAHNAANTDESVYLEHKVACRTVEQTQINDRFHQSNHDTVLESSLLNENLNHFDILLDNCNEQKLLESNFILDIDLDYFNSFKSIQPDDFSTFNNLIKNADLITIATEPEYVHSCAIDPGLNSEFLLNELVSHIESIH